MKSLSITALAKAALTPDFASRTPSQPSLTWITITSAEHYARRFARIWDAPGFARPGLYNTGDGWARPQDDANQPPCRPYYIRDVAPWHDEFTGKEISSRSQKREMMKQAGGKNERVYVDWEPILPKHKQRPGKGYVTKEMCEVNGLPYSPDDVGWIEDLEAETMAPQPVETRNLKYRKEHDDYDDGDRRPIGHLFERPRPQRARKKRGQEKGQRTVQGKPRKAV